MNMIVLVLMMAVTVEALIEYAKTFGKAIIESSGKPPPRRREPWRWACCCALAWARILRRVGCELQRGMDWHCAHGHFASRGANYVSDLVKKLQALGAEKK